jgi:hypothetical protein
VRSGCRRVLTGSCYPGGKLSSIAAGPDINEASDEEGFMIRQKKMRHGAMWIVLNLLIYSGGWERQSGTQEQPPSRASNTSSESALQGPATTGVPIDM